VLRRCEFEEGTLYTAAVVLSLEDVATLFAEATVPVEGSDQLLLARHSFSAWLVGKNL
jgi:hypothetical protein